MFKNRKNYSEFKKERYVSKNKTSRDEKKIKRYYSKGTPKFYETIKEKLFEILGGAKCHSCGFRDQRALGFTYKGETTTFDQVKRGGFAASWGKYISNPDLARKEIQILCLNCNAIREPILKDKPKNIERKKSKFFPRKENMDINHEN